MTKTYEWSSRDFETLVKKTSSYELGRLEMVHQEHLDRPIPDSKTEQADHERLVAIAQRALQIVRAEVSRRRNGAGNWDEIQYNDGLNDRLVPVRYIA